MLKFSVYLNRRVFVMICELEAVGHAPGNPRSVLLIASDHTEHQYIWFRWGGSKRFLKAHCQELCTLIMKSMPELPKLVQHLADYVEVFRIEVYSDLTQS